MAINNRTLDPSLQRQTFQADFGLVGTGATVFACVVPFASTLEGMRIAAVGLSGSPTVDLRVLRFIAGTGVTAINPGTTTLTLQAVGTSGIQSVLVAAAGSTLANLLPGDMITLTTAVSNTACAQLAVATVIKSVQDIRTSFGL